jgi:hypothetical protein
MNKQTQQQKEKLAPNFWELVRVWKNNPNDENIKSLKSELTNEELDYFAFVQDYYTIIENKQYKK